MKTSRVARQLARVTASTARRRLREGPVRPSWSLPYEALLDWMRQRYASPTGDLGKSRRWMDTLGELELKRRRVDWESVDAGGVPGEWCLPPGAGGDAILYLHGGGYVLGSVQSHRGLLSAAARHAGRRTLGIDYRLAPEHPCPAAIEDALAAYRWLLEQGIAPERLHVMGDSAGGGLALALLMALRDGGDPLPAGAVLLSPWTDLEITGESAHAFTTVDYLGEPDRLYAFGGYYAGDLDRRDPRVSPLYGDLSGLPPMLLVVGGSEILRDDSLRVVDRIRATGGTAEVLLEAEEIHVFPAFDAINPRARAAWERIGAWVAER